MWTKSDVEEGKWDGGANGTKVLAERRSNFLTHWAWKGQAGDAGWTAENRIGEGSSEESPRSTEKSKVPGHEQTAGVSPGAEKK